MYILNYPDLKKGDIILDRKDDSFNDKVSKWTNCNFVHARLYVGGTIIESDGYGVQPVNPQRILYKNETDVIVLRPANANADQISKACMLARSLSANEYGGAEFKRVIRPPKEAVEPNRQFCTRMVAQVYRDAGYPIVENANYCSAADIVRSDRLVEVKGMVHEASDEEIELALSPGIMNMQDETNDQNMSLVNLLLAFREASSDASCDIQNETQFVKYLIVHPELDERFDEILRNSDYFNLWKMYERENPEEFDIKLFLQSYGLSSAANARQMLESCTDVKLVWESQYKTYTDYKDRYPLSCFSTMQELYKNLLDFDRRRQFTLLSVMNIFEHNLDCEQ